MLFTTNPSVIVFRPTWKVNVKRMVLTSSRKWGQPPAVVCSACCRCSLKSTSHFVTQCNKLLQPHHKLWAIPHNSKCQYGERGAADAKPKAQIILDAAKVSAASGGNSEPKQGQRSQSARGFCPRSTMRVPQPDIIEHFGNADAVPQLPERCLSRKAGIVRYCLCFLFYLYSKKAPPDEKSGGAFFAYQVINVRAFPQHVTPCFPLFHAQTSFSTPSRTAFQSTA